MAPQQLHPFSLITPNDWRDLTRATLSGGNYLFWKAEFQDQCELLAKDNANRKNHYTLPMEQGRNRLISNTTSPNAI